MVTSNKKLTFEEFFNLSEGETGYELVDGKAIAKMSSKFFSFQNLEDFANCIR